MAHTSYLSYWSTKNSTFLQVNHEFFRVYKPGFQKWSFSEPNIGDGVAQIFTRERPNIWSFPQNSWLLELHKFHTWTFSKWRTEEITGKKSKILPVLLLFGDSVSGLSCRSYTNFTRERPNFWDFLKVKNFEFCLKCAQFWNICSNFRLGSNLTSHDLVKQPEFNFYTWQGWET